MKFHIPSPIFHYYCRLRSIGSLISCSFYSGETLAGTRGRVKFIQVDGPRGEGVETFFWRLRGLPYMMPAQRGRGCQKIPQICGQTVHRIRTRGTLNFADVIYGSPLRARTSRRTSERKSSRVGRTDADVKSNLAPRRNSHISPQQ